MIIDNNILFSLMKPDSTNSYLFSTLSLDFIAPAFILNEFKKHEEECLKKSGLSLNHFVERKKEIFHKLEFIEFRYYRQFLNRASKIIKDQDDVPYLAMALKLNLPIWSNDSYLKNQDKIKVLNTQNLINLFFD